MTMWILFWKRLMNRIISRNKSYVVQDKKTNQGSDNIGRIVIMEFKAQDSTAFDDMLAYADQRRSHWRNAHAGKADCSSTKRRRPTRTYSRWAFTYVIKNLDTENTGNVSGMLLYAKTDEIVLPNNSYKMGGNAISVKTLDLDCDFLEIRKQLDNIVEACFL